MKVIGLMSGTSLDGVDATLIETDGDNIVGFGPSVFLPYSASEQTVLRAATGLWPGDDRAVLDAAQSVIHDRHVEAVQRLPKADLIGFHGQTLAHDPAGQRTHQLGDGAVIAARTATRTVWDFRSEDLRKGGQGAPLVPFYHFALARRLNAVRATAFLNIGGVANVTWVDPAITAPEQPQALLAFDTGPGNALINDFVMTRTGQGFDMGGQLASSGKVAKPLLDHWMQDGFFRRKPPKSLDRNAWQGLTAGASDLSTEDGAATLTAFTAASVHAALSHFPKAVDRLMVGGGGRRNADVMRRIAVLCQFPVLAIDRLGIDGDMLEAQAFAFLAMRVLRGLPTSSPSTTGAIRAVCGGKISDG